MDDAIKVIRELGFPVAVAAFVLIRLERQLERLTEAITALKLCLARSGQGRNHPPPE